VRPTVILDGESLTPEAVARVARGGFPVSLSAEGRKRNETAYHTTLKLLEVEAPVYGMNTGVGALKTVSIPPDLREDHQLRLLRSHAVGAGDQVPPEISRAMLVVRGNQVAAGGAGVHPELLDALVDALNEGLAPGIRELGSLGTSDLTSLAEAGLALIGERPFADGRRRSPVPLGPRDGLMLMGSNAHAIGEAALCSIDLRCLIRTSETCAAIAFEAVGANPTALDARVHDARPHPGQVAAAEHLRGLLEGYASPFRRLQDSYAFRCLPQVAGVLRDAHEYLERVLRVEMNSATENYLLFGGEALTTGNFHAAPLAVALDYVRNAISQAASLSAARLSALMNPETSGLSPFLAENPGPDSGLMTFEYTVNSAAGELRLLATPAASQSAVFISQGVENHASFASLAARQTTRAVNLLASIAGAELVAAVRAFRMHGALPTGRGVKEAFDAAAARLPAAFHDRPLTEDLDTATDLVLREGLP
jgi:histidine ammonia-lyase